MAKGKVCVLGSFVVDLMMRAPRLPIPGETVKGTIFKIGPGGKGSNQGVAASRAGAETTMITKIGNDEFASIALNSFNREGMTTEYVFKDDSASTAAALIMVDENTGQNKIMVTLGASGKITKEEIDRAVKEIINSAILLMQLETNLDAVEYAASTAHANGIPIILNPAPADAVSNDLLAKIDYLTPNESEASFLCGFPIESNEDLIKAGGFFMDKGVKNVIFTLGEKGVYLMNANRRKLFPPFKVNVVDTTGAGDAFNGGFAAALSEKMPLEQAIIFASAVGALNVTKIGTAPAMPYSEEIDRFIKNN